MEKKSRDSSISLRWNFLKRQESKGRNVAVIADEQGQQMQQREQFQIDIAFAIDEFDFFN